MQSLTLVCLSLYSGGASDEQLIPELGRSLRHSGTPPQVDVCGGRGRSLGRRHSHCRHHLRLCRRSVMSLRSYPRGGDDPHLRWHGIRHLVELGREGLVVVADCMSFDTRQAHARRELDGPRHRPRRVRAAATSGL